MGHQQKIAGLDIGTSSLKVTLADAASGVITDHFTYPYLHFTELAPGVVPMRVYEETVLQVLSELSQSCELRGIAVATQMYAICEEWEGQVVAHQWNSLCERRPDLEPKLRDGLAQSGCRTDTIFGAYKAAVAQGSGRRFLPYGLKEHLIQFLTGELFTDYSTASASGLFHIKERTWNQPFVASLGLNPAHLPRAIPHHTVGGKLRQCLLPNAREVLVAPGLGDGPSASWACRDVSNFCGNIGTSMAARVFTKEPDLSEENGLWNYAVDEQTMVTGGISSNSCSVLNWVKRFGLDVDVPLVPTGDVIFLPWLHGERMPYWSSDLRGSILGLQVSDSPETIAAAAVKSIAFTFVRMAKVLEQKATGPLVLAGGGTNVSALVGVIAGCVNLPIALIEDGGYLCSTGAAFSAGEALGIPVSAQTRILQTIAPTANCHNEYTTWLSKAREMEVFYRQQARVKEGSMTDAATET